MTRKEFFKQLSKIGFELMKTIPYELTKEIEPQISHPHIFLLMYVGSEKQCTVTSIARHMGITLSGVTTSVDKLYNTGFLTRERSETDRRNVVIGLTDKGKNFLHIVSKRQKELFDKYFLNINEQEISSFINTLNKIKANIINND